MPPLCMCSIQALLSAPNPDDPLAENVAKHWKDNEQEAVATGKRPPISCDTRNSMPPGYPGNMPDVQSCTGPDFSWWDFHLGRTQAFAFLMLLSCNVPCIRGLEWVCSGLFFQQTINS